MDPQRQKKETQATSNVTAAEANKLQSSERAALFLKLFLVQNIRIREISTTTHSPKRKNSSIYIETQVWGFSRLSLRSE